MKTERYAGLVEERRACTACEELANPSRVLDGALDCDHVGPYSQWQGNLDADIVVVAQDFADVETFKTSPWPGERVATNLTLVALAACAGYAIQPPRRGHPDDRLFFTNAVLCMKEGDMQTRIRARCYRECGQRFLRPTIELVEPLAVAALGVWALEAVLAAHGLRREKGLVALIEAGVTYDLPGGSRVFPLCHPSPTVINTTRSLADQQADWARMGEWIRSVRSSAR